MQFFHHCPTSLICNKQLGLPVLMMVVKERKMQPRHVLGVRILQPCSSGDLDWRALANISIAADVRVGLFKVNAQAAKFDQAKPCFMSNLAPHISSKKLGDRRVSS